LISLTAAPIDLLLLVLGQVGARTGVMLFSFEQHHKARGGSAAALGTDFALALDGPTD